MTQKSKICEEYSSCKSLFSDRDREVAEVSLVPVQPRQDQPPAFFDSQTNLFSENPERSWIECLAAATEGDFDDYQEWMNLGRSLKSLRIVDKEQLGIIAKLKAKSSVHAFFIQQKNSNSPLLLTRDLFDALVSSNQAFERLKEFVMSFGWKKRELDIGPPHCRFERNDEEDYESVGIPNFECAYGLRYVELNRYGQQKEPWSVRQTAFYQKYDQGKETWILISPSEDFETKIKTYIEKSTTNLGPRNKQLKKNPFELHSILITAAMANWRWYIKSLVERATEQSSRLIAANVGKGKLSTLIDFDINFEDRQILKVVEDRVLDLFTIFDSTSDTITTILHEYELIRYNVEEETKPDRIICKLRDNLREVALYKKKVETLHKTVQGTASLLSDLLDYENAKIAERNSQALTILARESGEESYAMRTLTERGIEDAAAVKVITVITILFLPTTVVASFFSTQFVKQSEDGNRLELTENWWLIVAVSLPLTIVTIAVWYCWIKFPWGRWRNEWQRRHPSLSSSKETNPTYCSEGSGGNGLEAGFNPAS